MVDALIVGAGPTGLTLGCELIKRGLEVRLIEQLSVPTTQSRALALHSRTLEVFEKMGILEEFLKKGIIVRQGNIYYKRKQIGAIDFSGLTAPHPFILVVPQSQTEKILSDHFVKLGGNIERGVCFPTNTSPAPKWIFGCDGAHSAVRHSLNLSFKGAKFSEMFALADALVSTSLSHDQAHLFFLPDADAALFPLPEKNCFRLIILTLEKGLDLSFFQSHIDKLSPVPVQIKKLGWTSAFSVHRRITPKMRVGNTFLLGDAAHIHSPLGGQGLNTSIQDAFNLAWKIALVHEGLGKEILLDSFEKERLPVAKSVLRNTTMGTRIISSSWLKRLLVPLFGRLLRSPSFQSNLTEQMSELDIAYPHSPIIAYSPRDKKWGGPLPGQRAPDALLSDNRSLFDLLHPLKHTLLCFGQTECQLLMQEIADRFPQVIDPICLSCNEASSVYPTTSPCFYLIRPDGVIAYRSRCLDPAPFVSYLSDIFRK